MKRLISPKRVSRNSQFHMIAVLIAIACSFASPKQGLAQNTESKVQETESKVQETAEKDTPVVNEAVSPCPTSLLFYHMGIYYYETKYCDSNLAGPAKGFSAPAQLGCDQNEDCNETNLVSVVSVAQRTPTASRRLGDKIQKNAALNDIKALLVGSGASSYQPLVVETGVGDSKQYWVVYGCKEFNVAREFDGKPDNVQDIEIAKGTLRNDNTIEIYRKQFAIISKP